MIDRLMFLNAHLVQMKWALGTVESVLFFYGLIFALIGVCGFGICFILGHDHDALGFLIVTALAIILCGFVWNFMRYRQVTVDMPEDTPAYKIQQMDFEVIRQNGNQWVLRDNGSL